MTKYLALSGALLVAACSTTPLPAKRPLSEDHLQQLATTNVVTSENVQGVKAGWFQQDSSATSAQYGLIGALVSATMDGIANAGPASRARAISDEIATVIEPEVLDRMLTAAIVKAKETDEMTTTVNYGEVSSIQKVLHSDPIDDSISVTTDYILSEDATTLKVIANVSYENKEIPYVTPFTFEGSVPKSEEEGPLYKNIFAYISDQQEIPPLTDEMKAELVEIVKASYRDEDGQLPTDGVAFKKLTRDLENAKDDKLSNGEASIFTAKKWTENDGEFLYRELAKAHDFIARYIIIDMNDTSIPSIEDEDVIVEELEDFRTITRAGGVVNAGSYVSTPGNYVGTVTFGNAQAVTEEAEDRLYELHKEARKAKKKKN
ncbi:hypothetical protein [Parvularcula marina]|uniref:Uncharacterized protein n=1 Tax=Parvularcula marina TaxID=2292771 RepID=A0A371R8E8_9PROT|nr:hypothetical protein [Parvularcula marina]RFB01678.1 hypothetical protein DX908_15515 [Parvularcula marina]